MTPFDWASLSLNGSELPPATVGGSPLTSGGHVAPLSEGGFVVGCASATFVAATVTNTEMIGTTKPTGKSSRICRACVINVQMSLNVPRYLPGKERAQAARPLPPLGK